MLSDTEASCLAIALAVCLKKKKRRWMKVWLKNNKWVHQWKFIKRYKTKWTKWFSKFFVTRRHIIRWTAKNDYATNSKWNKLPCEMLFIQASYFFSEVSTQRLKFFNQLNLISIRKSLSVFAKQMFVLFICLFCCCNPCSWHSTKPVKNDILLYALK
jgi:hypothetical protein